jgi:hypothetical protein
MIVLNEIENIEIIENGNNESFEIIEIKKIIMKFLKMEITKQSKIKIKKKFKKKDTKKL